MHTNHRVKRRFVFFLNIVIWSCQDAGSRKALVEGERSEEKGGRVESVVSIFVGRAFRYSCFVLLSGCTLRIFSTQPTRSRSGCSLGCAKRAFTVRMKRLSAR